MDLPKIPISLDDWSINTLDLLIQFVGIESDEFDFKKEPNELEEHLCAFANTKGGYLVLGIEEIKSEDKSRIVEFKKHGFQLGKEDSIKNRVSNAILNIEPSIEIDIKHLEVSDSFYTVLKIENKISSKPFFVKSTDQCFVRINTSKIRANRNMILQLFSYNLEQINNIRNIHSSINLVQKEFHQIINLVEKIGPQENSTSPLLDLSFLRNAILNNTTFLNEMDLIGDKTISLITVLHTLELMNTKLNYFNNSRVPTFKEKILKELTSNPWTLYDDLKRVDEILDKSFRLIGEYLKKIN